MTSSFGGSETAGKGKEMLSLKSNPPNPLESSVSVFAPDCLCSGTCPTWELVLVIFHPSGVEAAVILQPPSVSEDISRPSGIRTGADPPQWLSPGSQKGKDRLQPGLNGPILLSQL
ncbi:uncharacterized protein ACIQIH_005813 [Cyanocitta cristata]